MAGERERRRGAGRRAEGPDPPERAPVSAPARAALRPLDPSDPLWRVVELAQRGRMRLDVTAADLEAAEAAFGPFHPTAWHFRNAWYEARNAWDRLRAQVGGAKLVAALEEPPLTVLALGPAAEGYAPGHDGRWPLPDPARGPNPGADPLVPLVLIGGRTYRVRREPGTPLAPRLWRLTRLHPPLDDGPYYAGRLRDGTCHCDCAEWAYRPDDPGPGPPALCKHLAALAALGWL